MKDEEQLAALVLLLQLPSNQGISHDQSDGVSELQHSLEQNDCTLLCFVGRLIKSYASEQASHKSCDELRSDVKYTLLRLAVRVAFMRYASSDAIVNISAKNSDQVNCKVDMLDERIFEWEKCLLKSMLDAIKLNSNAHSDDIFDVDVEMAWSIVGLLMRWSGRFSQSGGSPAEIIAVISTLWIESIDVLMVRHQKHAQSLKKREPIAPQPATISDNTSETNSDESLMLQTTNSILDGSTENNPHREKNDWTDEYSTATASCIRAYLQTSPNPQVTKSIILGMIQWSQQKDAVSLDMYWMTLEYLNLCLHHALGDERRTHQLSYLHNVDRAKCYFYKEGSEVSTKYKATQTDVFNAIKTFLFYGIIVLCNDANISQVSIHRGEIYSSFLGLWQLLGAEWLYELGKSTSCHHGASSLIGSDWWQRSDFAKSKGGGSNRLGETWQLCTLVRLAAGEFRLSMGRWLSFAEEKDSNKSADSGLVSEMSSCAQIVIQAVQLMTSLADDQDEEIVNQTESCEGHGIIWTPDAILHIRKSLEDALNTSIQYFDEHANSLDKVASLPNNNTKWEDVGSTCCLVLGTIAPDLDLDQLLTCTDKDLLDSSSFVKALCEAVLFCDSAAKYKQLVSERVQLEYDEPLTCLLPCIMSIVSSASSDFDEEGDVEKETAQAALVTLCCDGDFVNVISEFLSRLFRFSGHGKSNQQESITSVARLAIFIVTELLSNEKLKLTSTETDRLSHASSQWETLSMHP